MLHINLFERHIVITLYLIKEKICTFCITCMRGDFSIFRQKSSLISTIFLAATIVTTITEHILKNILCTCLLTCYMNSYGMRIAKKAILYRKT